jgi:hypothetical protein
MGVRKTLLWIQLFRLLWRAKWLLIGAYLGCIMKLQGCEQDYKYNLNHNPAPIWRAQYDLHKQMGWGTEFRRWL